MAIKNNYPTTGTNGQTTTRNIVNSPNQHQTAAVYDLISEGPIEGLVDGASSIYLDTSPILANPYKNVYAKAAYSLNIDFDSANLAITDNSANMFNGADAAAGTQYVVIKDGKKLITTGLSGTANSTTLTAASSFFAADDISLAGLPPQRIRITGANEDGSTFVTTIEKFANATSVSLADPLPTTFSSKTGTIDKVGKLASVSNATYATISNITAADTNEVYANGVSVTTSSSYGTAVRDVTGSSATISTPRKTVDDDPIYNHGNVAYAFLSGAPDQPWLQTPVDIGSASVIYNANTEIKQTDLSYAGISGYSANNNTSGGYSGNTAQLAVGGNVVVSSTQLGIGTQVPEVDRLKLAFRFDQLYAFKAASGDEAIAYVELRIFLQYKKQGQTNFTEKLVFGPTDSQLSARPAGQITSWFSKSRAGHTFNSGYVQAECKNPFIEMFDIDLSEYAPLEDVGLKIQRVNPTNAKHGKYIHYNPCVLQSVESILIDKLSYPHAAYAALIFDAEHFQNIPKRGYEVKGMKIKVPTNYFPAGSKYADGTEVQNASYTRNKTTGANDGQYVAWDGTFRGDRTVYKGDSINFDTVYCNNPAWVFYDILTNDRYGLGTYITKDDVDIYELYKIARYCDELVPDGKGGTEPRFTCNVYLKEQAEAIKVLNDLTTIFRGMLLWMDGKVYPAINRLKNPVYTFSKANVLEGAFTYQSTRNRFRHNQIKVTWNDPEANYEKQVLFVEDTDNIIKTRQIRSKDTVAFGCTSEGQATRYGKWQLLSEQLEKETVSFATSINASFLKPGDVIRVQDADRNNVRFSGRVSTSSNTTHINIDGAPNLSNSSTYNLHLIYPEGGAFLQQDNATILGGSYQRGDFIQYANNTSGSNTAITSSILASNAVDDSGNVLDLVWSGETRVETQEISSYSAGQVVVGTAFTSAPNVEVIWGITEIDASGEAVAGSTKEYVVQSIQEDSEKLTFTINALEYARKKFGLVDRGYDITQRSDVTRPPKKIDTVPAPTDMTVSFVRSGTSDALTDVENTRDGIDILISWQHPQSIRQDKDGNDITSKYEYIKRYELQHNVGEIGNRFTTQYVDPSVNSYRIKDVQPGQYRFRLRVLNTIENYSAYVSRRLFIDETKVPSMSASRLSRLAKGGVLTVSPNVYANGLFYLAEANYDFTPQISGDTLLVRSGTTPQTQQAFSSLSNGQEGYVLYDYDDTADPLKALVVYTDVLAGHPTDDANNKYEFEYLGELGAANSGITKATGTVTISNGTGIVTGSGTTFTTQFAEGDRIIIGDAGNTRYFAAISQIASNTSLYLDQAVPRSYSGANVFYLSYNPDFVKDTIIGTVANNAGTFAFTNFTRGAKGDDGADGADGVDGADGADGADGTDARAVNLTVGDQTIEYDTNNANPSPSSTTVTATALNTSGTVYYEFFKNDVSVQNTTSNTYSYSAPSSYTSMPEKIEVQIREGSSSGTILARDQITISGLKAGTNAITIVLSNEAHTLPTTSAGVVTYTGSGTDIEVWNGTTQVPYDGSSPYASPSFRVSAAGTSITPGSASTVSTYTRRFADHSSMTADNAAITYTIIVKNEAGVENTFTRKQSFAKSIQGADGANGANGPRNATGYIYYQASSASSPTSGANVSATSVTYNWSTSRLAGGVIGTGSTNWNQNPPTYTGSNSNKYWYAYYSVVESSFGGAYTVTFSIPYEGQNFTGLVTFTGTNTITDGSNTTTAITSTDLGSSGTTTIDGGRITTGTIDANRISIAGKNISDLTNDSGFTDDTTAAAAYGQANSAYGQANSAYGQANSAYGEANSAHATANSKVTHAAVNTSSTIVGGGVGGWSITTYHLGGGAQSNPATRNFNTGVSSSGNASYLANGGILLGSDGFLSSNQFYIDTSGNAFFKGDLSAATVTIGQIASFPNTAAMNTATTNADTKAGNAYSQANTATTNAGNAYNQANSAYGEANSAHATANTKVTHATVNASSTIVGGGVGGWGITTYHLAGGAQSNPSTRDFNTGISSSGNATFLANGGIVMGSDGFISAKQFYIDASGNAKFKGDITGATGTFSGSISIGNVTGAPNTDAMNTNTSNAYGQANTATNNAATAQSTADSKTTLAAANTAANTNTLSNGSKTGGAVGGWTITASTIASANITIDSSNQRIVISDGT